MTLVAAGALSFPANPPFWRRRGMGKAVPIPPPARETRAPAAEAATSPGPKANLDVAVTDRPDAAEERHQIAAARRGEVAAFEALVHRHQTPLYNFCVRLLGNSDEAKDAVQETLVQLFGHLGSLSEHERLSPWLFRVARNRCIDTIRRRRTVPLALSVDETEASSSLEPVDEDPLPDALAERADLQRVLTDAIATLPPTYADVVALRYAADRSFGEIADILGESEGNVRVRFHRAKSLLRRHLRDLAVDG